MPRAQRSETTALAIITAKKSRPMLASAPYFSSTKGRSSRPT
jgi:hypothetical protein